MQSLVDHDGEWEVGEDGQDSGAVGGDALQGAGDLLVAGQPQDRQGQVADGGHDLGTGAGVGVLMILAPGDVADLVVDLYPPVVADQAQ